MAFGDRVNVHVDSDGGPAASWPFTPTAGHALLIFACRRNGGYSDPPDGWDKYESNGPPFSTGFDDSIELFVKTSDGTEAGATFDASGATFVIVEVDAGLTDAETNQATGIGGAVATGPVTPTAGAAVAIFGGAVSAIDTAATWTPGTDWTEVADTQPASAHPAITVVVQVDGSASGTYDPEATPSPVNPFTNWHGVTIVLYGPGGDPDPEPHPDPVPEPPGAAIVEIYVAEEGADLWDVALWDAGVWASSAWTDIGPWTLFADVTWGTDRPEAGILADTVAGTWVIETHDPERVLDPSNADSQFATELVPGLPIRIRHRGLVIRTGVVTRFWYSFADEGGRITATDGIAGASVARVPEDTVLADTLYARCRDAIAAAGIELRVAPTPSHGDFDLAPWAPGDFSVWEIVAASAREALRIPYLDNVGTLRFRPWSSTLERGAAVSSPELIDLVTWVDDAELYSVVRVEDVIDGPIERRATPLPRYGERVHERILATIDGGTWADTVLADRRDDYLRFRPGEIRPETAADVDRLGGLQILEGLTISVPEAVPDVEVRARTLGFRVRVSDETLKDGEVRTRWRWQILTSLAPALPLIEDGSDPPAFLHADQDPDQLLYPDGVNTL